MLHEKDFETQAQFYVTPEITSNWLILTLLLRCNEIGMLYTLPTNYRLAMKENLLSKHQLNTTMVDCATSEQADKEDFNNSHINVMFYKLRLTDTRYNDSPKIVSVSREDITYENTTTDAIKGEIPLATATYVNDDDYNRLAYILNLKPKVLPNNCLGRSLFDFQELLKTTNE